MGLGGGFSYLTLTPKRRVPSRVKKTHALDSGSLVAPAHSVGRSSAERLALFGMSGLSWETLGSMNNGVKRRAANGTGPQRKSRRAATSHSSQPSQPPQSQVLVPRAAVATPAAPLVFPAEQYIGRQLVACDGVVLRLAQRRKSRSSLALNL